VCDPIKCCRVDRAYDSETPPSCLGCRAATEWMRANREITDFRLQLRKDFLKPNSSAEDTLTMQMLWMYALASRLQVG
jgi:hypothetical protein